MSTAPWRVLACWAAVHLAVGALGFGTSTKSGSLALSPDGKLLVVANPESHSLTLLDTASRAVAAEVPVGLSPQAVAMDPLGHRAFVTGRLDDSLAVVSLREWRVVRRRSVGDEPTGVVATRDGRVVVAETGAGTIAAFDSETLTLLTRIAVEPAPRGLTQSPDGARFYVTHFTTGRVSVLDARTLAVLAVIATTADANLAGGLALDQSTGLAYLPLTRSNSSNPALLFDTALFPIVSVLDLEAASEVVASRIAIDIADRPASRPIDAALPGDGTLWVLHAGSGDLSVLNLASGKSVAHLEVGENPTGIVLSPDGREAWVNNTLSGTVSRIDVATRAVRDEVEVTRIPLRADVRRGKILSHTSRPAAIARDRWISCAACHFEGESDGRTWFFPDGPRNTPSLLGLRDTLPMHWTGDLDEPQDVEMTVRTLQAGTGLAPGGTNCEPACDRGPPNTGRSQALDDLAAFLRSLALPGNPNLLPGGTLSAPAKRGQAIFFGADTGCATCHPPPLYTDRLRHDVGTGGGADERRGSSFDTPSLRGVYKTAPYLHDGRGATLAEIFSQHNPSDAHGHTALFTGAQLADLTAFLESLPFEEESRRCREGPTVGCLSTGRVRAEVTWRNPRDGRSGSGSWVRFSDRGGGFAFFHPERLDLAVKLLDGGPVNGALWAFVAPLTNVEWTLTLTDVETGTVRRHRGDGAFCGAVDLGAFGSPARAGGRRAAAPACSTSTTALCLAGERFQVEARWHSAHNGPSRPARVQPLLEHSGALWFHNRTNPEIVVKLVDGSAVNGSWWLFHGALTDLEYELRVTDTVTGIARSVHKPQRSLCGSVDLEAFEGAPQP